MKSINIRHLSQNTSKVIDEVLSLGETIEVTVRGRGSVTISPVGNAASPYDTLVTAGRVRAASPGHVRGLGLRTSVTSAQLRAEVNGEW